MDRREEVKWAPMGGVVVVVVVVLMAVEEEEEGEDEIGCSVRAEAA